jgi:glutaredoxin 3
MKLTVYSKDNCPFCDRAKNLLKLKGIEFEEVRIDLDEQAKAFIVSEGHRTVPQIYRNGELFVTGGYNGLARLNDKDFNILKESQNVN